MASPIIRNFIAKKLFEKGGAIANRKSVDFSADALEQRLTRLGVDTRQISSEKELNQLLAYVKQMEDQAFNQEFSGILKANKFQKNADIIDFPQKRSFKQEVDDMVKDGTITKGTAPKQSDKVRTRQMFKDSNLNKTEAELKTKFDKENQESIQRFKDKMKDNPEDMADGGVAGLLGERTGFRGGGAYQGGTSSRSRSRSSPSRGPAGGASAGGNYGGNVNPQQTYAGRTLSQRSSNYGGTGPTTGGPPGTNTGGRTTTTPTTTTPTTTQPSFRESFRQKQILDYLNSLEEEDLALGAGPTVLGTIFKEGVKGFKPKISKKGLGLEYLKEMDPYGNSLKFNLGTEYKDLLKGDLKPKLGLKGTKGNLEYGFDMDKDKNFNFGIKMPFGKQPPEKVSPRNFKDRFAPDISKFNFEDLTGIPSQAPTNMQMAKVYSAPELTEFGATPGMFKDTAKFNDMEKYQEIANKQFKMGKEPSAIRDSIKIGSSLYGIDMDNIPKDFLETKEDFKNQKILGDIEFADGGPARQNFAMGRRAFLKMLAGTGAGIAGLKSGLIGTGGKEVTKKAVTETVKSAGSGYPPPYFFKLVDKIKFMGDDVTQKAATQEREVVKRYKDYEMTEDLGTGDIVIKKRNEGSFYDQDGIISDEYIVYKPGQADELTKGKKPPPEYDEYTVRPDADGKLRDSEDGLDSIDEILEEVGDPDSMTLKRASGGIARMLGE
jgi:hypothetical protein